MHKHTKRHLDLINNWFDLASIHAITAIETEARYILEQRLELDEFVMAMGSFFFTSKDRNNPSPNNVIDEKDLNEPEFYEMVWKLNDKFNCCGHPMRFKAGLPTINNW